ncbi:MAG TPA: hypothetical protein VMZ06_03070 [Candidatus Bathyarchaeia archaeon]|nr:hypothetical protein [Candidatus Bathyarchaeia archaeon]
MDIKVILNVWQRENDRITFSGDPEKTIKQIRRKQRGFFHLLIFSDLMEAGVAIVLALFFIFVVARKMPAVRILVYLGAAVLLLVAAFFIVDRFRQERKWKQRSLADEINHYLLRVNRRIYLLRNVFWWYLLPGMIAWLSVVVAAFIFTIEGWKRDPLRMAAVFGGTVLLGIITFILVYRLNQFVVRKDLIPRKQELEQLLHDLTQ